MPPVRIAVTGLGAITAHGASAAETWAGLLAGRRGGRRLSLPVLSSPAAATPDDWRNWAGAPAAGIDREGTLNWGEDPVITLARRVADEAVTQASLNRNAADPTRVGCVFGTSKGGFDAFQACWRSHHHIGGDEGSSAESLWASVPPDVAGAWIAADHGWQGPLLAPVAACATGLVALIRAAALIREEVCDVVLAGSSDASLQPALLASFRRLGVLAPASREPALACRPFDADRAGFIVGEGAGAIVLERWEHAVARGTPILAEWVDGLQRGDPHGLTLLPETPTALVRLIRDLLDRAGVAPESVDAVSLHGTGTPMNDAYESRALADVWGDDLPRLGCFGVKGGIGHLLGAAGSVESVASLCALKDQVLPPTVNCDQPAPDCPIPLVLAARQPRAVTYLLKLSLGFGGHLAAGLLRRR